MDENLKVAICLIAYNENQYIEEWLDHHRKIGFNHFFIYDNMSTEPIQCSDEDVTVIRWENTQFRSQSDAYIHCCRKNEDYDYIAFIDADEFICLNNFASIQEFIKYLRCPDGIGMNWRMYGKSKPYFETRQPAEAYVEWFSNAHIKSIVKPKMVKGWPDPHKAVLQAGCRYVDENNDTIMGPFHSHVSYNIWVKHIWTRSLSEFKQKLQRGDANLRKVTHTFDEFYHHNDKCEIHEEN